MENKKEYSMDEMEEMEYEELAQLWLEKEITSLQFVESLTNDCYPDWEEWLRMYHRERDEQAAKDYIDWTDEQIEKFGHLELEDVLNFADKKENEPRQ